MSVGREPRWLYDKAQRQIKRREDLADYERLYREEAGLPEGPLDLFDHVGLELALKTHELFMDRVFWGEGSGEMTGIRGDQVHKLAWYDPRPPMEPNPSLAACIEAMYREATAWFEDASFEVKYQSESPLALLVRRRGRVNEDGSIHGFAQRRLGIPRQEVNLSRETMDLLASSLDRTLEHYGTSEHADPRGFWMPIDVESDHRREDETQT